MSFVRLLCSLLRCCCCRAAVGLPAIDDPGRRVLRPSDHATVATVCCGSQMGRSCRNRSCWCPLDRRMCARAARRLANERRMRRDRIAGQRGGETRGRPGTIYTQGQCYDYDNWSRPRRAAATTRHREPFEPERAAASRREPLRARGHRVLRVAAPERKKTINANWCSCCRCCFPKGDP